MPFPEREDSCTITWNPRDLTIDDLAELTSLLVDLHNDVAVPYVIEEFTSPGSNVVPPKSPSVASISMGSPIVIQLVAAQGVALNAIGMVGWILDMRDDIAGFLPGLRGTWHRDNRIADEEKLRRIEDRLRHIEDRGGVEARGRPIRTFEREYRTKGRDRPKRSYPRRDGRSGRS
jgi:hypothetical protein